MHNSIVILSSEKIVSYEVIISLGKLCTGAEKFLREIMQLPTRNSEEPEFCYLSKNLYNHANYIVRNEFVKNDKWIRYNDLDKMLKADSEYPDYRNMPTAQSAQQILRLLDKNWKSFFSAIKDWAKNI